jgi:DNA polymerase elongation subunit (family B)
MKSSKNNMILAAFITAYGRIQLNKIQRDCDKLGLDVIYSDTDSVYFMCDHERFPTNK